ncbi:MAG: acetate kinase [Pseudomonadota bacterium]
MRVSVSTTVALATGLLSFLPLPSRAQTVQTSDSSPTNRRPSDIAPIFPQPGILTPAGSYVLEPAIQFSNSSSKRAAIVGFNVIPLLPGFMDTRDVERDSTVASLTLRHGVTNRLELEIKVPYAYRSDTVVGREVTNGVGWDRSIDSSGKHLGDVELTTRYQLNEGGLGKLYFLGGMRFKSRTGRDPFEVVNDCSTRCVANNTGRTGLPLELATGSGFRAVEPSLTWLLPSNPAIFFGTFSYMHNFKRSNVSRRVLDGEREPLGEIKPGAAIGVNVGVGLALNEKAAVSFGYDHVSIGRTRQNGETLPGSVRTQLGTAMVGFSYRIDHIRSVNVSLAAGLTRDAPDVSVMLRLPMTF